MQMLQIREDPSISRRLAHAHVGAAPESLTRLPSSLASNFIKMMKNKKRKITSTSTTPPWPLTTTIASLPDDVMADILLRLPSAAAIYRAVLASAHWIRVASCPTFLRHLRDVHDDYPLLLGHVVAPDGHGSTPPYFYPAPLHCSPESDGVVAAMVRRGDFFLTHILQAQGGSGGRHVLEDCRGGLLLFSDDAGTLRVFDPMTHRVSSVEQQPRLRGGKTQDHRGRRLCLLPNGNRDDDPGAFRVMSLQHGNSKMQARVEVYDSCTRAWSVLYGTDRIPARKHMARIYRGQYSPAMHAGDRIFWKYDVADTLLLLDTEKMTFSDVCLPPGVTHLSAYAVGAAQDGTCCLVCVLPGLGSSRSDRQMQLWRFKVGDGNGDQMWELERQVPLILQSPSAGLSGCQVGAIVDGIVLLCFNNSTLFQHHIAFRLKSLKVEADFTCRGLARPFVIK